MPIRVSQVFRQGLSRFLPALGATLSILVVFATARFFVPEEGAVLLVASMGASAVLLFCVPEGPLSRPWAVLGGQTSSAIVGVACSVLGDSPFAAAVAVGGAIAVMQALQCVHPPGGATALAAVVGGGGESLGLGFVVAPVLLNVSAMLLVASLFHWPTRRYPLWAGRGMPARWLRKTRVRMSRRAGGRRQRASLGN